MNAPLPCPPTRSTVNLVTFAQTPVAQTPVAPTRTGQHESVPDIHHDLAEETPQLPAGAAVTLGDTAVHTVPTSRRAKSQPGTVRPPRASKSTCGSDDAA
jgi:phage tail protein X